MDLEPHEWQPHRFRPDEPFWGPGLPGAFAYVVGFAVMATITYWLR